jgi:hypothetical protein
VKARAIAVATFVAFASMPAYADHPLRPERIPNKARQLAAKGRAAHTAGDYTTAVEAFKEAYVLAPSAGLLFNIAQAYRLAGNCDDAAWMYRRFLDTNPTDDERSLAENQLAAVKKCGSGGLRVTLNKPRRDTASVPEVPALVLDDVPTPDDRGARYKRIGIGTAVGGGALLAGAALFAYDAHDASKQVAAIYKRGGTWDDIKDIDARGQRNATIATALGIGGGAAVVSGAVLYAIGRRFENAQRMTVTPRAHGAQVTMSWDF